MTWSDWDKAVTALCIWREARGEPPAGQQAICHVILTRMGELNAKTPGAAATVVEAKWQFSSMTAVGDSQLILWPRKPDPKFDQIMDIVEKCFDGTLPDNTDGATHYFNPQVVLPVWAKEMVKTVSIGHHDFYK